MLGRLRSRRTWNDLLIAVALPVAAAAAAELLNSLLGLTRLAVLFLASVAVAGSLRGRRAALVAAAVSVVCYRVFLEFSVGEPAGFVEDVLNAGVFLLVALLTGTLAGRVREEAEGSRARAETMERLFEVSSKLSDAPDEDTIWRLIAESTAKVSNGGSAIALDGQGRIRAHQGPIESTGVDLARSRLDGSSPPGSAGQAWQATAVADGDTVLGALAWSDPADVDGRAEGESIGLVIRIGTAALARDRARRAQVQFDLQAASNRLRDALLSSISHDFRSPLSAIIGSASSLLEYGERFPSEVRRDLLLNIQEEGERLNQYVANLLNMIRLEAGVVETHLERVSVGDVAGHAIGRLSRYLKKEVKVDLRGDCFVLADRLLLEQSFYNVLDNAMKYGHGQAGLEIDCRLDGEACLIGIADHGPGLGKADLDKAFEKFHFAGEGQVRGSGLGLSITKGFVEAMGGSVAAGHRQDGRSGLAIRFRLPRAG